MSGRSSAYDSMGKLSWGLSFRPRHLMAMTSCALPAPQNASSVRAWHCMWGSP